VKFTDEETTDGVTMYHYEHECYCNTCKKTWEMFTTRSIRLETSNMINTHDDSGVKVFALTPVCPVCGLAVAVREGLADGKFMLHKQCFKETHP